MIASAKRTPGGEALLKQIKNPGELPWEALETIYGRELDSRFLRYEFFAQAGAALYLWEVEGQAVSALRIEPWKDGVLVTALQTASGCENRGYATMLLRAVLEDLGQQGSGRVYAHIRHGNVSSIRVHEKCGFQRIADTARLLDGTVTARLGTYEYEIDPPEVV